MEKVEAKIIIEDIVWWNEDLAKKINKFKSEKIRNFLWITVRFIRKLHPYLDKKLRGKIIVKGITEGKIKWD